MIPGVARVIAIDNAPEWIALAKLTLAEVVKVGEEDVTVLEKLKDMAGGNGFDQSTDAVRSESQTTASLAEKSGVSTKGGVTALVGSATNEQECDMLVPCYDRTRVGRLVERW